MPDRLASGTQIERQNDEPQNFFRRFLEGSREPRKRSDSVRETHSVRFEQYLLPRDGVLDRMAPYETMLDRELDCCLDRSSACSVMRPKSHRAAQNLKNLRLNWPDSMSSDPYPTLASDIRYAYIHSHKHKSIEYRFALVISMSADDSSKRSQQLVYYQRPVFLLPLGWAQRFPSSIGLRSLPQLNRSRCGLHRRQLVGEGNSVAKPRFVHRGCTTTPTESRPGGIYQMACTTFA